MNKTGEWGEIYACRYLREKGIDIVSANYNCRFGEIDIVGIDKKHLVFFEVKARSAGSIANPAEFVTESKQRKTVLASSHFISHYSIDMPARFDVIEVYFKHKNNFKDYTINHIKNAYSAD